MIASEAPILFSKACEIFIEELTTRAWMQAEESKRRTLQKQDISNAISRSDMYDFLIDIVPRDSEPPYKPKVRWPCFLISPSLYNVLILGHDSCRQTSFTTIQINISMHIPTWESLISQTTARPTEKLASSTRRTTDLWSRCSDWTGIEIRSNNIRLSPFVISLNQCF